MNELTFIIIDKNAKRRNTLQKKLEDNGYVIPLDFAEELGASWPTNAWILTSWEDDNWLSVIHHLESCRRFNPVIPYGDRISAHEVVELMYRGCAGYIEIPADLPAVNRILEALRGSAILAIESRVNGISASLRLGQLTTRERQVVEAIGEGDSCKTAARRLGISHRTVEVYKRNAMRKLDAGGSVDLVRLVCEAKNALVEPPSGRTENELTRAIKALARPKCGSPTAQSRQCRVLRAAA